MTNTQQPANPPTTRGDREARRRDVLDAAREILVESGWDGLGIRAIASRAGVSSGAVYQWFSGKEEIFGELYQERIESGIDLIGALEPDTDLAGSVEAVMCWVIDIWESLGRYELEFVEVSTGRSDRAIAPALSETYKKLGEQVDATLAAAAARDGVTLTQNPHRITWFWAACIGVAERLLAMRSEYQGAAREALIEFSVEALTTSLVER